MAADAAAAAAAGATQSVEDPAATAGGATGALAVASGEETTEDRSTAYAAATTSGSSASREAWSSQRVSEDNILTNVSPSEWVERSGVAADSAPARPARLPDLRAVPPSCQFPDSSRSTLAPASARSVDMDDYDECAVLYSGESSGDEGTRPPTTTTLSDEHVAPVASSNLLVTSMSTLSQTTTTPRKEKLMAALRPSTMMRSRERRIMLACQRS